MNIRIESLGFLLIIAAVMAMALRRLKVPYTVGLILTAIVLAVLPFQFNNIGITKDLIFRIFLPTLIYAAAIQIKLREVLRDLPVILTFATVGLTISATVTAAGMYYFAGWEWQSAALFGILIAAIDPVSVMARIKEAGEHGRLPLFVETESLFNNRVAATAFIISLAFLMGGSDPVPGVLNTIVIPVIGGIICGLLVTGSMLVLAGHRDDRLVQIIFTTVAAYGSILLADYFHFSGVLASLVAGFMTGNLGSFTDQGREEVLSFWEFNVFVVNLLIFVLIGIRGAFQDFTKLLIPIAIAIVLVLAGRALAIYPLSAMFSRSVLQVSPAHQHILFWGGLRGALALALALGLPPEFPQRETIIVIAFAVVAFSIFTQGLSIRRLLRKLGEIP